MTQLDKEGARSLLLGRTIALRALRGGATQKEAVLAANEVSLANNPRLHFGQSAVAYAQEQMEHQPSIGNPDASDIQAIRERRLGRRLSEGFLLGLLPIVGVAVVDLVPNIPFPHDSSSALNAIFWGLAVLGETAGFVGLHINGKANKKLRQPVEGFN